MIFTPEESREIAESMLGWEYEENVEYMEEGVDLELGWRTPTGGFYLEELGLPDFSLPEWTGPMLEKVLALLFPYTRIRFSKDGYASVGMGASVEQEFIHDSINRNLYDAWKYLKEASNVRLE